jgi:hypothetical protein
MLLCNEDLASKLSELLRILNIFAPIGFMFDPSLFVSVPINFLSVSSKSVSAPNNFAFVPCPSVSLRVTLFSSV